MASDFPPGVVKGSFTFSPKPGEEKVDTQALQMILTRLLSDYAAPGTEVGVEVHYQPIR